MHKVAQPVDNKWTFTEDSGWSTSDPDAYDWCRNHTLQCSGITTPRVVKGMVVEGRRCQNKMRVGFPRWFVVPMEAVPLVLCHAHRGQAERLTAGTA